MHRESPTGRVIFVIVAERGERRQEREENRVKREEKENDGREKERREEREETHHDTAPFAVIQVDDWFHIEPSQNFSCPNFSCPFPLQLQRVFSE